MSHIDFSHLSQPDDGDQPTGCESHHPKPVPKNNRRKKSELAEAINLNREELAHEDELLPLWIIKFTQSAYYQMMEYLLSRRPESAGILLGPSDDDLVVTHFVPDKSGHGTPASFVLDAPSLNEVLKRMKEAQINCKGIVHSHPTGIIVPSSGDIEYLRRLFDLPSNSTAVQFFMPIVSGGRFHPYVYVQGEIRLAELVLI